MRYITTQQRGDGFGAVYHHIIYDILYANKQGDRYVFTPQVKYEHNYANEPDYVDRLNRYMGLEEFYPRPSEDVILENYDRETVYKYVETHYEELLLGDEFKKIQEAFFKGKENPFSESDLSVCVHIRRVNSHDNRLMGSETPLRYYEKAMEFIASKYMGTKHLKFHIFSQKSLLNEDLTQLERFNPEYHIDEDLLDSFTKLVYSDVLVTSWSCYSRTPAFLTRGLVVNNGVWIRSGTSPSPPWWVPFEVDNIF